jgi:hypothetical protein
MKRLYQRKKYLNQKAINTKIRTPKPQQTRDLTIMSCKKHNSNVGLYMVTLKIDNVEMSNYNPSIFYKIIWDWKGEYLYN